MTRAAAIRRQTQFRRLLEGIGAASPIADDPPGFNVRLKREAEAVMRHVEKHPADIRALMHEYGVAPVTTLLSVGIKKPRTIRHIIEVCRGNSGDGRASYGGNKPPGMKVQQ